jgi:RimJ/RimL family protein N-acetyltransferase
MEAERQVHTLTDGTEVQIRGLEPTEEDFERYFRFFSELPEEDRLYLQVDVTDPEVVRLRLKTNPLMIVYRVVVLQEDRIVADATLRSPKAGWMSHVGEIRIIIARDFRSKGLASMLYRKLFIQAVRQGLEKIEAHMTPQQGAARKCVERLGFREEGILPGFVMDIHGNLQDLVIMSSQVDSF